MGQLVNAPERDRYVDVVARLADAQKSNRGAAGYSRWVNRKAGRRIAAVAHLAGLTPNQVSAIGSLFTFPAVVAMGIFRPTSATAVAIVAALLIGYAFDSADGQVARLRGGGSYQGEWLDHVLDALKVCTFHLAVAVMWFRYYLPVHAAILLIPLGFAAVYSTFYFAIVLSDMLRRVARATVGGSAVTTSSVNPQESASVLRSLIVLPNDYGVMCLVLLLAPAHGAFIVVYSLLLAANVAFLGIGTVRWMREMAGLGVDA